MHLMGKVGHEPEIGHCCPFWLYTHIVYRIVILWGTSILVSWYIRGGIKLCSDPQKGHSSYSTCASSWSMGSLEQSDLVMDMIHENTVWPYFVILCLHIFKASWTMKVLLKQTWSGVWYIEWKVVKKYR